MGEMISFKRPDGKDCSGYYAEPAAGDRAPGVVVIQEWWGLNDQIKGVANRLADLGYRALVPDLYRGKVTVEVQEANHLMTQLDFADAATQDIRGAVQELKKTSPKAGVVGFCMGGALTVLSAVFVKELDAASSWYGFPPEGAADVRTISIPVQFHFASKDQFFTPEQARALEAKLREGKVNFESYWYDANHGFGNEANLINTYDAEAAKLAWQRTTDFFAKYLR
ncbi:MAG TPA: dienelactone hydrolase family protein [Candidatus Acidoferrales bacterium]|nr:dienelactone hydrolase family protein [Candidatus Acidoferrales bacterium]